jgi:hypothetical protein
MLYCWDDEEAVFITIGPAGTSNETIDYIDGGNAFGPY